jgi:hypothetical protein
MVTVGSVILFFILLFISSGSINSTSMCLSRRKSRGIRDLKDYEIVPSLAIQKLDDLIQSNLNKVTKSG